MKTFTNSLPCSHDPLLPAPLLLGEELWVWEDLDGSDYSQLMRST